VPIVTTIYGRSGHPWFGTHHSAERAQGSECRFAFTARAADYVAHVERSLAKLQSGSSTANVRPQTHALRVDLPEAECGSPRSHAVGRRSDAVGRRGVPGHDAIGRPAAPLEVAVRALPSVAENEA